MLRIRTGGVELEVPDEAALKSMQADGLVGADAEIHTDEGWRPVAARAERPPGDDPWAAWNDVDASKAEQIYETYVQRDDDAVDLPGAAVAAMPRPIIAGRPPGVRPPPPMMIAPEPPPLPDIPVSTPTVQAYLPPPTPSTLPKVEFPLPAERSPPRATTPPPVADPPLVRPARLAAYVGGGLLVLGGMAAAFQMSTNVDREIISVSSATPAPPEPEHDAIDILGDVERHLRSVGLGDAHEVLREGDLGDGILIDLQKFRLDVERVDAPVTRWVGRKQDDPDQAEVHITFRSSGELDRELGAIAMVVGRYQHRYSIEIPIVEAIFYNGDTPVRKMLNAKQAESFFVGRTTLAQLLGFDAAEAPN